MLPYKGSSGTHLRKVLGFIVGAISIYNLFSGTAVSVKADVPFEVYFQDYGQFDFVALGVGTRGNPGSGEWTGAGSIVLDLPDTAVIQKAQLIWTGRSNQFDPDGVQLQVDGGSMTQIAATKQEEQYPWCCNGAAQRHESADVTSYIQPGTHTYRISDHEHGMAPTGDYLNYGVGILVVYEDASLSPAEVIIHEGQDSFFRLWTPPRGPHSQVSCADFSPDTEDRTVEMTHLVSGVDTIVDIRSNAFWYMTGSGSKPAADSVPGLIGQPGAIGYAPVDGYPFQSYTQLEWDNFSIPSGLVIPAGATWICFQIESGDSMDLAGLGNIGTPASGMWELFGVRIAAALPAAVSLTDFSVERVSVGQVDLRWETAAEVDHFGFNLYRGQTDNFAEAELIHFEPSLTAGGSPFGTVYHYSDTAVTDGQWWYWLESVDTFGQEVVEDTLTVTVPKFYQHYLPFVIR